jgi:hypothetical protein
MTLKIVGNEQIVCDCTGNTPDTYQDQLLVGIAKMTNEAKITVFCPECDAKMLIRIPVKLDITISTGDVRRIL